MSLDHARKLINNKFKKLNPIDDDAFSMFAKRKDFCEEFLRVILNDDKLVVVDNAPQKTIPSVYFKESRLDMLCKLKDGRFVNVEIQLYNEEDSAKRIFYYASKIRQFTVKKGTKYKDISDIIIIYLTKDDIFNMGSTVYNVEMNVVSDTKKLVGPWNCGLKVIYVNTVGLTNATINEYLKLLTDRFTFNKKYPVTTQIKESLVTEVGENMSEWLYNLIEDEKRESRVKGKAEGRAEGKAEGRAEGILFGKIKSVDSLVNTGTYNLDSALEIIGLTRAEYDSVILK